MALSLDQQLAELPPDVQALLAHHRFDPARFKQLAGRLGSESAEDNFMKGTIKPPPADALVALPPAGSPEYEQLVKVGEQALREGRVALLVLAGGMATRMGGVIKALVDAIPGKSFLDLRRAEMRAVERRYGVAPALWLMTSHSTDAGIRQALGDDLDGQSIATFTQHLSLRVTPKGDVFFDKSGKPSEHAPGHGDLPDALRESGLLSAFVQRGGQVILMTNIDNMGGTLDSGGHRLSPHERQSRDRRGRRQAADRSRRHPGECRRHGVHLGRVPHPTQLRPQPSARVRDQRLLLRRQSDSESGHEVELLHREQEGGGRAVVQFERLVNEVTSTLPTIYLHSPRTGPASRFLPVKDNDELALREPEILAVAKARGIV